MAARAASISDVQVSELSVDTLRRVQAMLREAVQIEGNITSKRRLVCVLTIAYALLLLATYVLHTLLKMWLLPRMYPIAFKWYFTKFDVMYPMVQRKRTSPPGEAFRSMWDIANGLEYSMFQKTLNAMALEKTVTTSQAEFLLLSAQNFAKRGIDVSANMWDYDGIHQGMNSAWYTGLAKWLPRGGNTMGESPHVANVAWAAWQLTAATNPFYHLFASDKDAFFQTKVIKEYLFYRRGLMTSDLEYLYFGGLCYAAQMCSTDTEGGRTLFLKFFADTEYVTVSCAARTANGAINGMASGFQSSGALAMPVLMAAPELAPILAIAVVCTGVAGALVGGVVASAKCKSEEEDKFGKHK
tara:strand:+ start:113 stop:1180 length:1068 start_codon:yes stop_codon:yes gene_type:complete